MMNLHNYMKKVGVTKAKYVERWIEQDLIPGIEKGESLVDTKFPDSARRPYCEGSLKPGLPADKIRAHIVKACIQRKHITKDICFASQGEFDCYICDLEKAGLITKRIEDGIVYYDSTLKSDTYNEKSLAVIRKLVCDAIEAAAKGATSAMLEAS